jgi:hypothetical protein
MTKIEIGKTYKFKLNEKDKTYLFNDCNVGVFVLDYQNFHWRRIGEFQPKIKQFFIGKVIEIHERNFAGVTAIIIDPYSVVPHDD